jgi:hypothetical protein
MTIQQATAARNLLKAARAAIGCFDDFSVTPTDDVQEVMRELRYRIAKADDAGLRSIDRGVES